MSRDVVKKLLQTSRSIDQMRAETDEVVNIVLGLIQKSDDWRDVAKTNPIFNLPGGAQWELGVLGSQLQARYIRCIVEDDRFVAYDRKAMVVDYSSAKNWIKGVLSGNRIEFAWKTLPDFVAWTLRTFPALNQEMESFFDREAMA